ncbi:hypothetical protein Daus18300_005657 [Diaporthe australafricana]|uniref:F-box domain-containing protein n=1 Tax=Diaporthe australafricana TaxID=127596 RepID=A0ABR3WZJ7_9PEZI
MTEVFECNRIQESAGAWAEDLHRALSAQEESITARIYTRPLIRLDRSYISELPDELLAKIFLEVAAESSRHVLSTVKTNKLFHNVAIPLLYNRLELLPGRAREDMQSLGLSFRRHPQRRGYAREAKLRGSPEHFRSLGQIPVLFSNDAFPNMKRLHCIRVAVSNLQSLLAADELSTGTSTIEELIFEESEVTNWPAGINALMSACKMVRKLVLHWGSGAAESSSDGEYLQEAMGSAIARHATTLETLEFKPNECQISTNKENESGSLKDQLVSFLVLKDLTIHMACFNGGAQTFFNMDQGQVGNRGLVEYLPPSLERLALEARPEALADIPSTDTNLECMSLRLQITAILHRRDSNNRFPRLKLVQLPEWVDDSAQGRNGEDLPQLKELARSVGVEIMFKGKFPSLVNSHNRYR